VAAVSADMLREAATLMRERAEAATQGPWRAEPIRGIGLRRADVRGLPENTAHDYRGDAVATAADSEFGACPQGDAEHIASWHPAVALAVADWLDAVAAVHWPKRHDRLSESHYNAEPEHACIATDCDETCWIEGTICNGCGTDMCKPEITTRALAVARAYLGRES
jgi:hypothetical protein